MNEQFLHMRELFFLRYNSVMGMNNLPKLQSEICYECTWLSPAGMLRIAEDGQGICLIAYADSSNETDIPPESHWLAEAVRQLDEYFSKKRTVFDLPLSLRGTPFQKRIWDALYEVPYGRSMSYQELADKAGSPKGARAAGMAVHVNPCVILVPCHRIIGKDGSITGYGGGLERKRYLLRLEGIRWKE